jgi:hypothetical protein
LDRAHEQPPFWRMFALPNAAVGNMQIAAF